jgi:hypothetical protein
MYKMLKLKELRAINRVVAYSPLDYFRHKNMGKCGVSGARTCPSRNTLVLILAREQARKRHQWHG